MSRRKPKYHFLVINEYPTGRMVVTLPDQDGIYESVLVKDKCPDKALTKIKKRYPIGTVIITSTLKDRFSHYEVRDCFTVDSVPVHCNDAIPEYDNYFASHPVPEVILQPNVAREPDNPQRTVDINIAGVVNNEKEKAEKTNARLVEILLGSTERHPFFFNPVEIEDTRTGEKTELRAAFMDRKDSKVKFFQYGTDKYLSSEELPTEILKELVLEMEYKIQNGYMQEKERPLYSLVTWPDCQILMDVPGFRNRCKLVNPGDRADLDSAYLVPDGFAGIKAETHDSYALLSFEETQKMTPKHNVILQDYDGNTYLKR